MAEHGRISPGYAAVAIECGLTFDIDTTKRYKAPSEDLAAGTFVQAPSVVNGDAFVKANGDVADHILLVPVTENGFDTALFAIGVRQRVAKWGDYTELLKIVREGDRIWVKLYATGSDTGAIDPDTATLDMALGIHDGILRVAQPGDDVRALYKAYDADRGILTETRRRPD